MSAILVTQLEQSQIDELLQYVPAYTESNYDVIRRKCFEKIHVDNTILLADQSNNSSKRFNKKWLIILVAVLATVLVGFTNADRIQRLFQMLFGGPVQLEQTDYSMIGESVINQGFQMDALSAVRDGENLYLLVELTDIEQDRLSDDLYLDSCIVDGISKNLGDNVASMSGIKVDLLEYDQTRKIATLGIHATGNFENEDAAFTLNGFSSGKVSVKIDAPDIDLYTIAKNSVAVFQPFDRYDFNGVGIGSRDLSKRWTFEDIQERLALDTMDVRIPGYENDYISNIAYKGGLLHVQVKCDYDDNSKDVEITLCHIETGEDMIPLYTLSYKINTIDNPKEERHNHPGFYQEKVYKLDSLELLNNYSLHAEGHYYQNIYRGKWQIRFSAPEEIASVDFSVPKTVTDNRKEIQIKKVTVTPLSVTIISGQGVKDSFNVTLIYANGERKTLTNNGMYTYENGDQEWNYTSAFLFQSIAAVEINGTRFEQLIEGWNKNE